MRLSSLLFLATVLLGTTSSSAFAEAVSQPSSAGQSHGDRAPDPTQQYQQSHAEGSPSAFLLPLFLTVLVVVLASAFFLFQRAKSQSSSPFAASTGLDQILILGQCNAGKTALFFLLRDGDKSLPLVSSLKVLRDRISISAPTDDDLSPSGRSVGSTTAGSAEGDSSIDGGIAGSAGSGADIQAELIDCPGHQRLRPLGFQFLESAKSLVYMIDGADKKELKNAAEHLYEIFTHPKLPGAAGSAAGAAGDTDFAILLALNKTDRMTRGEKLVVDEIERELERMRHSRGIALEGVDASDSYLGIEGEKFKLKHAPVPVSVCTVSVTSGRIGGIKKFLWERMGDGKS